MSSFVFRSEKPFHPERFFNYVNERFPHNIIRSKGFFWLASRPKEAQLWSQAGGSLRYEYAGSWANEAKQELVFIGQDMDKYLIIKQLETCLLRDWEEEDWKNGEVFNDPFAAK